MASEYFEEDLDELQEADDAVIAEADDIGQTSDEVAESEERASNRRALVGEAAKSFSIFDAMLVMSLICISVATFLMVWELGKFGSLPGFVWRTDAAVVETPE